MVDIVRTIYKELFTVKFSHDGFTTANGSTIFDRLTVTPDDNTKRLFKRYNMDYRCINDSVVCFVRSELVNEPDKEPKTPYISLEDDIMIRFLINAQPSFLSSTYVTAAGSNAVYHFTNKTDNVQNNINYITEAVGLYDANEDYDAGTIINHAGDPYVTLQPVRGADGILINNAAYWKKVSPLEPVVNNADLEDVATVEVAQPCLGVIDVFNTGTTNATYDLLSGMQHILSPVYVISFKSKI